MAKTTETKNIASETSVPATVEEVQGAPVRKVIFSSERLYRKVTKEGDKEIRKFVSSPTETDKEGKLKFGEPQREVEVGSKKIALPEAQTQLAGFEHEDAEILVRAVRGYKWLEAKGGK